MRFPCVRYTTLGFFGSGITDLNAQILSKSARNWFSGSWIIRNSPQEMTASPHYSLDCGLYRDLAALMSGPCGKLSRLPYICRKPSRGTWTS